MPLTSDKISTPAKPVDKVASPRAKKTTPAKTPAAARPPRKTAKAAATAVSQPATESPPAPAPAPSAPQSSAPKAVAPPTPPPAAATAPPPAAAKTEQLPPAIPAKAAKASEDRIVHLKPPIIVKDLATQMAVKPFQLISDLMQLKILVSINQPVDAEIARKLCEKHGFKLEIERRGEHPPKSAEPAKEEAPAQKIAREPAKTEKLIPRAPVVTIMGHVDHGKTSLLDAIRKTNVVAGEAGGITQHIGAYRISLPAADKTAPPKAITFLDTPGHEAFTAMRARGANVTDLVVLVVAASEGLMPQTIEAINHARAAHVPIIVALTKMDLEAAQKMKDRVKKQLQEHDLSPEDWGGKTITVEVSATKKTGVDQLLEMLLLQAEVMELKAEEDAPAEGAVIEAQMEAGRGPTATVLIRKGTLKTGDPFVVGPFWGKIKALIDDQGKMIKKAGPSVPVKIVGLSGVPMAGETLRAVASEVEAREQSESQQAKLRAQKLEAPKRLTLEDLISASTDNRKTLHIILKADVQGSGEAIVQCIGKLPGDKINVELIHVGIGPITETDVLLATASKALIIGFQVKVDQPAAETAKREGVQIQLFRIIYEIVDQIREFMAGLLDPEIRLTSVGSAEVKQIFPISKGGSVAGCLVTQGRIERKGRVRVLRRKNVLFEGSIATLRRFQEDVSDVRTGLECGIRLDGFNEYQPGDTIEVFHLEKVAQKI